MRPHQHGLTLLELMLALAIGSLLIAGMTAGTVIANLARHHERAFHEIEHIQWPFMILFFLLAGASLHVDALAQAGLLALGYIGLRVVGRVTGTRLGGLLSGADATTRRWIGLALLPASLKNVRRWLEVKQGEINAINQRPHPFEFTMYFDF